MNLAQACDRFLEACQVRGLAPNTIGMRRQYLRHFTSWLGERDLQSLRPEEMRAYARELAAYRYRREKAENAPWRALAPHTRAQRLWIVIEFLEWLVARRQLLANPASGLCPKLPPRKLPRRIPTESEMIRLLAAPNPRTSIGRRDRAILELMYSTGLRVAEVAALDVADLDLTAGTLIVRRGKSGKGRVVPLGRAAVAALLDYLQHSRPGFVQKPGTTALFLANDQNVLAGNRFTTYGIRAMVHKVARKAGIDRPIAPHQFRHACATHMLRAGCDLHHIQRLLGHARVDTTEIYTHVDTTDLAAVLARSHPRCTNSTKQRSR